MKKISFIIITIILTLGLSFSLQSLLASWTAPTATPPLDNASEPLNRGGLGQDKIGGLILNSGNMTPIGLVVKNGDALVSNGKLSVSGDITGNNVYSADKIGIKDASSSEALSVGGTIEVLEGLASPTSRTGHGKIYSKLIAYSSATDAQDKLLLHFDGSGSMIVDSLVPPKTVVSNGVSQVTSIYKFGGSSAYFNGTSYLSIPDGDDWNFGSGDFTVDFWFKWMGDKTFYVLSQWIRNSGGASNFANSSFEITGNSRSNGADGKVSVRISQTTVAETELFSSRALDDSSWHHLAFIRNGNIFKLFIDGVMEDDAPAVSSVVNSSRDINIGFQYIGSTGGNYYYHGYIDELRISKGVARWTANFTPNTAAYGAGSSASALFYMDGAGHEYQLGVAATPSAPTGPITLVGGAHTTDDCSAASGTPWNDGGGNYFCRMSGSSCKTGWTRYDSWQAGTANSCSSGGCSPSSCTAPGYGFTNSPFAPCAYYPTHSGWIFGDETMFWSCISDGVAYCYQTITEVGCK